MAPARAPADRGGRAPTVVARRRARARGLDPGRLLALLRRRAGRRQARRPLARLLRPGARRDPARLPRLLRDAASVRPHRLPRHADGRAARDLRLHGADRHARDGAPSGRRFARARRRRRVAGDPRAGGEPAARGSPRAGRACSRSCSCSAARTGRGAWSRPCGVGVLLIVLAGVVSTTDAVAKPAFLSWQTWDPYDRPTSAGVGRATCGSANYDGISSPRSRRTVMRVKVPGREAIALLARDDARRLHRPDLGRGPRAGRGHGARADRRPGPAPAGGGRRTRTNWIRQEFKIEALRDTRLPASAQPVRWRPETEAPVADENGERSSSSRTGSAGTSVHGLELRAAAQPERAEHVPRRLPGRRPRATSRSSTRPLPSGASRAATRSWTSSSARRGEFEVTALESVYDTALERHERGAVALRGRGAARDLVPGGRRLRLRRAAARADRRDCRRSSTSSTRRSAATASTTPARWRSCCGCSASPRAWRSASRAATTGATTKEWVVRDTNAHAWVEVWFPQFGWIPFDPTPGPRRARRDLRRQLPETYNAPDAADIGFADRLEGLSPTRAEAIRDRRADAGPRELRASEQGRAERLTVVRDHGRGLLTILAMIAAARSPRSSS